MPTVTLRASTGQFVCAEPDGSLIANRAAAGPWETFTLEDAGDGKHALKSDHGKYVCAEGGGGRELVANRDAIGGWEKFRILHLPGGAVALETDNGHFVCAEDGGGREVVANRTAIAAWETFQATFSGGMSPSLPSTLRGPLSVQGRQFRAGGAPFVWRFCSAFTLAQHYQSGQPARANAYLDWVQAQGFNGVRVFCGNLTWAGQTLASALRGLPRLLEETAQRGLYCELTALTDTRDLAESKGEGHVLAVAVLAADSGHAVLEICNEFGHGTQAGWLSADFCRRMGRGLGLPWAVGAPVGQDEPVDGSFPGHGGRYITSHLNRSRPFWDQVRRVRELFAIIETHKVPVVNNEPIGAASIAQGGRRESNPTFFRAMGALNSLFGVQGVFHLDAGLHCTRPSAVETACAQAFVHGHTVLGDQAGTRQYLNAGHTGSPVKGFTNLTRAYSFVSGHKGHTIALGYVPSTHIEWANGWQRVGTVIEDGGLRVWEIAK